MGKAERRIFTGVLILLLAAAGALGLTWLFSTDTPPVYQVSILLDGAEEDYWDNFLRGVDRAAQERNVDVRIISRYEGADVGQAQAEVLSKEVGKGADGVILAPVDWAAHLQVIQDASSSGIRTTVAGPRPDGGSAGCYISADPVEMGRKLADAVAEEGSRSCTVYLSEEAGEAACLRLQGLEARLEELGIPCRSVTVSPDGEEQLPAGEGALLAVEPGITERLCREAPEGALIFGMDTSNDLLHHLEEGRICALVVQCDYEAGYLSLQSLVGLIEGAGQADRTLSSYTVTAETMFEDPMDQILFPIS